MKINYFNVLLTSALFLTLFMPVVIDQIANAEPPESIEIVKSGLIAFDPLNTGNTSYWTPWSSTVNTPLLHEYHEDSQGLHIGVQAPYSGKWVNYAAVSPVTDASLFHATVTNPYTTIPDGVFESGLYVISSDNSNFVGCMSVANYNGHYWSVIQAYGSDVVGSGIMTTLYQSPLNTEPLTQECTIVTNGDNHLRVYLDGSLLVSRDDLVLNMPDPFRAMLQVDATSPTMHTGTYLNYYSTSSEAVTVTNARPGGTVLLVDSSNRTLASAPVVSDGISTILVGMHSLPLVGNILIYDANNTLVSSTPSPVNIFGGDVYSSNKLPQPPTGLTANAISSSQINISWSAPADNGGSAITGYKIEKSMDDGSTWSTIMTGNTTTYADAGLLANTAYTYRVSAINSVGTGSPSNAATATTKSDIIPTSTLSINTQRLNGAAVDGLYIQLYQNGVMINSGYSPVTFTLNNDQPYTIVASDWIGYFFDHWLDTGSTNSARGISISADTAITAVYKTLP
jgi:hypothetical protein